MSQQIKIPCTIMRGGTSKALFFHEADLPEDQPRRDQVLLAAFGSPDPRQIDGLGGSYSTTSKAAIIGPSQAAGIDVNYTFGQVSITAPLVDYRGNCGNISSAVGPFAIDEGLVAALEPCTCVRILNTNTNKVIEAEVPVAEGCAAIEGDCVISGVPGSGGRVRLGFVDPGGSVTGQLLPTGRALDILTVPGLGEIEASLVDAGNPGVFVRARDAGLLATELPDELDAQPAVLERLERIRSAAAVAMGLVEEAGRATELSPAVPKIAIVAPPTSYRQANGATVQAEKVDVVARIMSMQRTHRSYAITGAIALAAAAGIPGTVVAEVTGSASGLAKQFRLGHPAGTMTLEVVTAQTNGSLQILKVIAERTARRLMDGYVYVPQRVWLMASKSKAE
ncbi:MAG: PrpF domain-containing protein [Anaerolineae bacterium]